MSYSGVISVMSKINSGDGERTAMLGYVPQYEIAAGLIYEALLDGTLEWFRVADPDAGSLDDILIATTGKLDAYQVKWAEYIEAISYSDFVIDSTTKKGAEKLPTGIFPTVSLYFPFSNGLSKRIGTP